jgi:methionine sulfoxide reductase heme-binding subunit
MLQCYGDLEMHMNATEPVLEGWRLLGATMAIVTAISGVLLVAISDPVSGVHLVIRVTAWTSFAMFMLAFTAAAMTALLPGGFSQWQRRNRRFLGLSFAFSHLVHAVAIIAYVRMAPELFWQDRTPLGNIPGLVGYVFIVLMAITSFDATARFVGPRLWKLIHGIGIWIIWFDFVAASAKRVPQGTGYSVPVVIALSALGLRAIARRRRRHNMATIAR